MGIGVVGFFEEEGEAEVEEEGAACEFEDGADIE